MGISSSDLIQKLLVSWRYKPKIELGIFLTFYFWIMLTTQTDLQAEEFVKTSYSC